MSFFNGPMGGPRWDIDPMMMPPGYGPMGDMMVGTYGANQIRPSYYRRGRGGGFNGGRGFGPGGVRGGPDMRRNNGGNGMGARTMGGRGGGGMGTMGTMGAAPGGGMGVDPFVNPESLRDSRAWSGPGRPMRGPQPFGRGSPVGRTPLKDLAARSTQSFDAEVIKSMNSRSRVGAADGGGGDKSTRREPGGERRGTTTSTTSTSSQYVPLSSTYGTQPRGPPMGAPPMGVPPMGVPPMMDRSPPLSPGPPPPMSQFIDTSAMSMDLPPTIQAARTVRPSVVLVTSKGVRKENSQGSGFVVAFDDQKDDEDDDELKERVHILTSAHVAPPGWKVSVTFPQDPDKQYPAAVVGRKLNSDLALLCVETIVDSDDVPFPPPLVLTGEDVSTEASPTSDASARVPSSEIGSPVYSFGYPMGVEGPTMTSGILSATTKGINYMDAPTGEDVSEVSKSRPFENTSFVITDAAMAGGMSGGPLVSTEGVVLGINALVRPDLRALGNYAVSALECETFLERLEDKMSAEAGRSSVARRSSRVAEDPQDPPSSRRGADALEAPPATPDEDEGVAGYRVMLYGYTTDKADATKTLRRVAGIDELRAENAMRSANSFGAGVVDEFYVAESGNRERAVRAARKSADDLFDKLKNEGMMVEVEPLNLLK